MAIINPQVSSQEVRDPNYLSYARVVDAAPPNSSSALGIQTADKAFDGAITATDQAIKKGIQTKAYDQVDPKRDQFTGALEQINQQYKNDADNKIAAPVQTVVGSTTGPTSVLDAQASMDVPDGIDQGIDRVTQLSEARKAMKINDTQYSMETLAIAKKLRNDYGPGYRDYIDEQVSKASGLPVANSYYQNLMTDINRQMAQVDGKKDQVDQLYLKNLDVPNISKVWYPMYKAGNLSQADFIGKIADWQNLQTQYKVDAAKRAEDESNKKTKIDNTTSRFESTGAMDVNNGLKDFASMNGTTSTGALVNFFNQVSAGKLPNVTAPELDARRTQLAGAINQQYQALWAKGHEMGPDHTSVASTIGEDALDKSIKKVLAPLQTTLDLADNKDHSPANFAANQFIAMQNQDKYNFVTRQDTGPAARQMMVARGVLGDPYFGDYIASMVKGSPQDPFANVFSQEGLSAVAPLTDARGTPVPRYLKDAIQHGKAVNIPDSSEYFGKVIGLTSKLGDTNMPEAAKDNMIKWAFDPKGNSGVLKELNMDYKDPNTGAWVPGKYRAFNILSSDTIVKGVAENAKIHPENYKMFQGTLEGEFGALFREDIQSLNKVVNDKSGLHFSWNGDRNELGLVDGQNRPITHDNMASIKPTGVYDTGMMTASKYHQALDILEKVNGGLSNLANVQKSNPQGSGSTAEYLFKVLGQARLDPGGPRGITNAPEEIMKSIFKEQNPEATQDDLTKMLKRLPPPPPVQPLNFSADQDNSVAGFTRNPAGLNNNTTDRGLDPQQTRHVIHGNLSDEQLLSIDTQDIPEGMSARDFISSLRKRR